MEQIVQLIPTMKSLDADKKTAKAETKAVENAPEKEEVIDFSKVKLSLCLKNLLILIHLASRILEQLRLKNVLQYLNQRSCYSSLLMMEQAQIVRF